MKKIISLLLFILLSSCASQDLEIAHTQLSKQDDKIIELSAQLEEQKAISHTLQQYIDESDFDLSYDQYTFQSQLPILLFHYIRDIDKNGPDQLGYRLSNSPERFEEILKYLQENNITTLTFKDVKHLIENDEPFPEKSIMLTFDDGHLDHYSQAHRLLKQYNMKGVFYIVSDFPGNDALYADWDQIREMSDYGHEIGSHTLDHTDLLFAGKQETYRQLVESKKAIEAQINKPVISFAYPFGKYHNTTLNIASEVYLFARTTHSGTKFNMQNRYLLPTINMLPTKKIESIGYYY